jgi:hypothetical protein
MEKNRCSCLESTKEHSGLFEEISRNEQFSCSNMPKLQQKNDTQNFKEKQR